MTPEMLVEAFLVAHDGRDIGDWRVIGGECPGGGVGLCDHASKDFASWCMARDIEARIVWMELVHLFPNELEPHPAYPDHAVGEPGSEHCVVLVMDHVVDLTARQYDGELPFPFIWRP